MAHFVELDRNNVVIRGIVVNNQVILNEEGEESEEVGIAFCKSLYGEETNWKQTSYNRNFRKNYAGSGFTYDEENDAFIPPKPYKGWILNTNTFNWDPPRPIPNPEEPYYWDDEQEDWVLVELPDS